MDLDLGTTVIFNVKLDGKAYELREPSVSDVIEFKNKSSEEGNIDQVIDFIVSLGMPDDVARSMGITKLTKLSEGILGGMKGND